MQDHITNRQLEAIMDRFNKENPNADSAEMARHMFNLGFEATGRGGLGVAVFLEETARTDTISPSTTAMTARV